MNLKHLIFAVFLVTSCGSLDGQLPLEDLGENPALDNLPTDVDSPPSDEMTEGGSEVGNGNSIQLNILPFATASFSRMATRTLVTEVTMIDAEVILGQIKFVPGSNCDEEQDGSPPINYNGPYLVNLVSESVTPSPEDTQIPGGEYCQIQLRLDEFDDEASFTVKLDAIAEDGTPVFVRLKQKSPFNMNSHGDPFVLGESGYRSFVIGFDYHTWLADIDLSEANQTDGEIWIDQHHNQSMLAKVRRNVKGSSRLFGDADEDGELDGGEQLVPLAYGEGN